MPQATQQPRQQRDSEDASVAFRLAQAKLARELAVAIAELFYNVSPLWLIENASYYAARYRETVLDYRRRSRALARDFYEELRRLQGVTAPMHWPDVDESAVIREVDASFLVHGPLRVNKEIAKQPSADLNDPDFVKELDRIMNDAASALASDAMRLAENGGRQEIHDAVKNDDSAIAWYRQASSSACAFCLMLASRGAIYKTRRSAMHGWNGEEYHRNCHCQPVPIFMRGIDGDSVTETAKAMWKNGEIEVRTSRKGKKYPAFKKGQ
ncbi:hypothetical protein ACFYYS_06155 [Streptomyces sp. NPDC002120]|uniref:VG15 protein n=1 Tax=Streptomyces sp. NPDC002120 TaxID=3364631 RepID=UPI003684727A